MDQYNLIVLLTTAASGVNHQTICLGDSASVGTSSYYTAGVYLDTLISKLFNAAGINTTTIAHTPVLISFFK